MSSGRTRLLLALSLFALVMAGALPAHAGGPLRVVVEPFRGPAKQAAQAQRTVADVIAEQHELLDPARADGADAIVEGTVRRRGKRYTLTVTVRAAATGEVIETLRMPMRGKRLKTRAVADDLHDALAWIEPKPEPKPEPEPEPEPEPAEPEPAAAPPRAVAAPTRASDAAAPRGRAYAGVSVIGRQLEFVHEQSLATEQRPLDYDGDSIGGLHVRAELYPARLTRALPGPRALRALGVTLELDRAFGMRSRFDDGGTVHDLPTTQLRWGVGLRYGATVRGVELSTTAGFNRLLLHIDRGAVELSLPDVTYSYVDLGVGARVPLHGRLAATAALRYLIVTGAGEIVTAAAYGRASVGGYDVDLGLDIALAERLGLRVGARVLRFAFDFDGTGPLATDLDGDPDQDVGGASDRYLGGYALVGYAF